MYKLAGGRIGYGGQRPSSFRAILVQNLFSSPNTSWAKSPWLVNPAIVPLPYSKQSAPFCPAYIGVVKKHHALFGHLLNHLNSCKSSHINN
ncbi:MAG: hypothetical protein R2825_23110 [Saprospiraceae bacterium]